MSATNFTPIQLYRTSTAAAVPTAGNLAAGELAINLTDERLYFKNAAGVVKLLASNSGSLGTVTSVDVSGGTTGLTTSGGPITSSGTITLAGTLGVANGGTGTATAFTAGSVVFAGASGVYSQDNANLFWDNANDRLGIGTATPSVPLDVTENGVNSGLGYSNVSKFVDGSGNKGLIVGYDNSAQTTVLTANSTSASSNMAFWTYEAGGSGWAERMRVTAAGNVGIGVSSPAERLDVAGNAKISSGSSFYWGDATSQITAVNGGAMRFLVGNGGEKMRIASGGNVGIGTSSPDSTLQVIAGSVAGMRVGFNNTSVNFYDADTQVFRNIAGAERMRIDSNSNVGIGTANPTLRLAVASGAVGGVAGFSDGIAQSLVMTTGTGYFGFLNPNYGAITFRDPTNVSEFMRIDNLGNVGIGTSSPGAKFQVIGSTTVGGYANVAAAFGAGVSSELYVGSLNGNNPYIGSGGAFPLSLNTNGAERMRIDSSGNIGIGTSSVAGGRVQISGATSDTDGLGLDQGQLLITDSDAAAANGMMLGYRFQAGITEYGRIQCRNAIGATNLILQAGGGNVGIGTATAPDKLTVAGGGTFFTGSTDRLVISPQTAGSGALLLASNAANSAYAPLLLDGSLNVFRTSGTERARIDSSGNLLVGTTSSSAPSNGFVFSPGSQLVSIGHVNGTGSGENYTAYYYNSTLIGGITQNGTTGVLYNTSSDARLKHDIVDAPDAASLIDAIQVRSFKWNADNSEQRYGFIAQELVAIAPEAVSQPEDPDKMMGVDYSKLVPMMMKELQSLRARVAQLEGN
jgi:hypothetical protein